MKEKKIFIKSLKANKQISKGKKLSSGETHDKKGKRKRFSAL